MFIFDIKLLTFFYLFLAVSFLQNYFFINATVKNCHFIGIGSSFAPNVVAKPEVLQINIFSCLLRWYVQLSILFCNSMASLVTDLPGKTKILKWVKNLYSHIFKIERWTFETFVARGGFVPAGNKMYIPGWFGCFIKYREFYYLYVVN